MHIKSEISVFLIKRKKTLQVSHAKEMTIKKRKICFYSLIKKCPYIKMDFFFCRSLPKLIPTICLSATNGILVILLGFGIFTIKKIYIETTLCANNLLLELWLYYTKIKRILSQ